MKEVDLGEPTSFLDHVYLGCTHVKSVRILWIFTEVCSNPGFLPGLLKNCQNKSHGETWCRNDIFMACDMEGHAKKCVAR